MPHNLHIQTTYGPNNIPIIHSGKACCTMSIKSCCVRCNKAFCTRCSKTWGTSLFNRKVSLPGVEEDIGGLAKTVPTKKQYLCAYKSVRGSYSTKAYDYAAQKRCICVITSYMSLGSQVFCFVIRMWITYVSLCPLFGLFVGCMKMSKIFKDLELGFMNAICWYLVILVSSVGRTETLILSIVLSLKD